MKKHVFCTAFLLLSTTLIADVLTPGQTTPKVALDTLYGTLVIELFPDQAPITVENFLYYVNSRYYDNIIWHRAIDGFMIQTGAFEVDPDTYAIYGFRYSPSNPLIFRSEGVQDPIQNESSNGLSNVRGTISMALPADPNGGTSQFFINQVDNTHLDGLHTVFGQVVSGINIVDAIAGLPKRIAPPHTDVPVYSSGGVEYYVPIFQAQLRAYVASFGNDTSGIGSPAAPFKTVQKGIDLVTEPGHVVIGPGTYYGAGNRDLDFKGKSITVRNFISSDPGYNSTVVIDCEGKATALHRAFYFHNDEDADSVIEGLIMMGGYNTDGGAILCQSSPTIKDCVIISSTASRYGGAIYAQNASPMIANCTFSGNSAAGDGGAVCGDVSSNITMVNSIMWDNASPVGPEIALRNLSSMSVQYSDVQGGQAGAAVALGCSLEWGIGNLDMDPCFADPPTYDYHLLSQEAYFSFSSGWTQGDVTSPCIGVGHTGYPHSVYTLRSNMGGYGDTIHASPAPDGFALVCDIDSDGFVGNRDFALFAQNWRSQTPFSTGDFVQNSNVENADLSWIASEWLQGTSWYYIDKADLDGSGTVDFKDFALLTQVSGLGSWDMSDYCRAWLQKAR